MKQLIAGFSLLAAIAAFCVINAIVCTSITRATQEQLDSAQRAISWEERAQILQQTCESWAERSDWLDCVMHHDDVDEVHIMLARLRQSSLDQDILAFNLYLSNLRILIDHISHSSRLSLNELF